jgi:hypothetical protein
VLLRTSIILVYLSGRKDCNDSIDIDKNIPVTIVMKKIKGYPKEYFFRRDLKRSPNGTKSKELRKKSI